MGNHGESIVTLLRSKITGTGSYLPEKIMTNNDLAKFVDTSDSWITERSGIKKRHYIADNQATSDMGVIAAQRAIQASGLDKNDIDMIICATTTPDLIFPATASIIQRKLGIDNHCPAFDIQAVCAGFIFALNTADKYIQAGEAKNILVIGAESLSRIIDFKDRTTCVLFGDGAGAFILSATEGQGNNDDTGILSTALHTKGALNDILKCAGGVGTFENQFGYLQMEGKEVFKAAVTYLTEVMFETLEKVGLTGQDIDFVVPHQANQRIMTATAKKIGVSDDAVISTIADHGNTSAASIPLAFDVAVRDGRIQKGHLVLVEAIGGGMSWGGALIRI